MIALLLAALFSGPSFQALSAAGEVLAAVRVQGNVATPDDEIVRLAGLTVGMPIAADTVAVTTARLKAARRFDRVDVLKRYASISDPTQIVLVVLVDEGRVSIKRTGDPNNPTKVVKSRLPDLLYLPMVFRDDEYGLSYGVRVVRPNALGRGGRVSFPVTWGGTKRGDIEIEKRYETGWLTRLLTTASISRRTNPLYEDDEVRGGANVRGERDIRKWLRLDASAGWQHVSFLNETDRYVDLGAGLIVDTRLDPWLARDAVYARVGRRHLSFGHRDSANLTDLEAHGYLGLPVQAVLVASVRKNGADTSLPEYLKPLFGDQSVRGFRAGTTAGDNLVTSSLELRVPLTSPITRMKMGVNAFVDAGTVYDDGERFADQNLRRGVGGGVWFAATVFRFNVTVARGSQGQTRVSGRGGMRF